MKPGIYEALVVLSCFVATLASIQAMRSGEWGMVAMLMIGIGIGFNLAAFRWKADRG